MKGKDLQEYRRQRARHESDKRREVFWNLHFAGCIREDTLRSDLIQLCPVPWILDQDNNKGVCVKDNIGQIVFFDDFSEPASELPGNVIADAIFRSRMLAHFLVQWSEHQKET